MKKNIFLYLFIFASLMVLFMYVNSKKIIDNNVKIITNYKTKLATLKRSDSILKDRVFELSHFSIYNNESALSYFEDSELNTDSLLPLIKDALYEYNTKTPNPLIDYESTTQSPLLFNSIRILNHRWLIADFTNGEIWGETLISYTVDPNYNVRFELENHFLYPLQ